MGRIQLALPLTRLQLQPDAFDPIRREEGFTLKRTLTDSLRLALLCLTWLAAILQILFGEGVLPLTNAGVVFLVVYFLLTLPRLKRESAVILLMLVIVVWLMMDRLPSADEALAGGRFILIFAGLLPTMALVRATASTMPTVEKTQAALSTLPPEASAVGLQLAGHAFGSIINTGTFAVLSAALPPNSDQRRRRLAAEAALRGMNTSVTWSPFFVAFAVGQSFIDKTNSWLAIGLGGITALLFSLVTLPVFTPGLTPERIRISLACLQPIALRLVVVLAAVLGVALTFNFTALSAVVIVMPVLVLLHLLRNSGHVRSVLLNTRHSMRQTADDIVVISVAMLVGFLVTRTGTLSQMTAQLYSGVIPGWFALTVTPLLMTLASFVGIHPVITSTTLLAVFSGGGAAVHPALLMQAHLVGWAAGTISSVASLSVITCANLYQVPSWQLAFGPNLWTAILFALGSGGLLSLANGFVG